jgi:hypothetical protein
MKSMLSKIIVIKLDFFSSQSDPRFIGFPN